MERRGEVGWQKQRAEGRWWMAELGQARQTDEGEWRGLAGVTLGVSRQASRQTSREASKETRRHDVIHCSRD